MTGTPAGPGLFAFPAAVNFFSTACSAVITTPQVGARCLGISLGSSAVRVIARGACLRSSSAQILAAGVSVEGQRRVYAPGVTSPLSYARTTA